MKQVLILVRPLSKRDPDAASGVWEVTLQEETEPVGIAAGAALDTFHATVGIGELDDFEISAHDPLSPQEIYEADDYKRGGQVGDVSRIANSLSELQHRIPSAAVLLVGNPVDGCRTIGPFNEVTQEGATERANSYAEVHLKHEEWWVSGLEPPATP